MDIVASELFSTRTLPLAFMPIELAAFELLKFLPAEGHKEPFPCAATRLPAIP